MTYAQILRRKVPRYGDKRIDVLESIIRDLIVQVNRDFISVRGGLGSLQDDIELLIDPVDPDGPIEDEEEEEEEEEEEDLPGPLGFLRDHLIENIDSRIAGKSAVDAKPIFSTQDHDNQIYVRNPDCWAGGLDLTCFSPWNSAGGAHLAGTLISPDTPIFSAHYQPPVGTVMRFVKMDGTVVERTITAMVTHPQYGVPTRYYPDIAIGRLDSPILDGISFAKILPPDWADYLPTLVSIQVSGGVYTGTVPALRLDQEEKALVGDLKMIGTKASFATPTGIRAPFHESIIGGDSSNPAFLIIQDQLVLLTTWTNGGAGSGTSTNYHKAAINTMMAGLGSAYQLTEIDLGEFTRP